MSILLHNIYGFDFINLLYFILNLVVLNGLVMHFLLVLVLIIIYNFFTLLFNIFNICDYFFVYYLYKKYSKRRLKIFVKAMPQLDTAIISFILVIFIIFLILGYLFSLVIINRIYYIVMVRNYFFLKFEFNLIQQLDFFLKKNSFLLNLLDLKVIGLSELLIENIINNFINYLLLIKKIYFKLNF